MASISLSLAVTSACVTNQGGGAAWTPASLFTASETGAYYDVQDLSTMYQEVAGTTPVTAVGQSVGYIADLSGNGNHLTAASDAALGTLRQNSLGAYYIELDGARLAGAAADFNAYIPSVYAAAAATTLTSNVVFGAATATNRQIGIKARTEEGFTCGTTDPTYGNDLTSSVVGTLDTVGLTPITCITEVQQNLGTTQVNGGAIFSEVETRDTSGLFHENTRITVGTSNGTAAAGLNHFYGGVILNRDVTTEEKASLNEWLLSRCGLDILAGYDYDLFAVVGQSNGTGQGDKTASTACALGQGAEFCDETLYPMADPTRHSTGGTVSGNYSDTGSMWPAFCSQYYALTGRRALIASECRSGIGIAAWDASWATYGPDLTAKVAAAQAWVSAAGGTATLAGVIHVGGETDAAVGTSQATTETNLASLLGKIQTAFSDTDLPFFIVSVDQSTDAGQDAGYAATRAALAAFATSEADAHLVVPYQEFEINGQLEDTVHWNQTALNTAGSLAATNIAGILYP